MYFLFHVFAGIVIGLLLADLLHDNRWVIPCVIGAALPDLIDKPLGYILLPQSIGYGRFFFHNFFIFLVIFAAGLIIWKYRKTPVILAIAVGILSHQFLDSMWLERANWFYPLLGPIKVTGGSSFSYLVQIATRDLYNPSEWLIAAACIAGVLLFLFRNRLPTRITGNWRISSTALIAAEFALWITAGIVMAFGVVKKPLPLFIPFSQGDYIMTGVVIVLAAVLFFRWATRREEEEDRESGHG